MAEETPVKPENVVAAPEPTQEMPQAVISKRDEPPRLIKVNGEYISCPGCGSYGVYGEYGLKHAITYFVDELLQGNLDALPAPHIVFGTITLKLRRNGVTGGEFVAYGVSPTDKVLDCPREWLVDVSSRQDDVLLGLLRFAKNPQLLMFIVNFGPGRELRIWKRPSGGYCIVGIGLPPTEELWDWHPHS